MRGNVQHGLILTKELAFVKSLNCLASTHYLPNSTNGLRMSSKKFQDCIETTFKQCTFLSKFTCSNMLYSYGAPTSNHVTSYNSFMHRINYVEQQNDDQ